MCMLNNFQLRHDKVVCKLDLLQFLRQIKSGFCHNMFYVMQSVCAHRLYTHLKNTGNIITGSPLNQISSSTEAHPTYTASAITLPSSTGVHETMLHIYLIDTNTTQVFNFRRLKTENGIFIVAAKSIFADRPCRTDVSYGKMIRCDSSKWNNITQQNPAETCMRCRKIGRACHYDASVEAQPVAAYRGLPGTLGFLLAKGIGGSP